MSVTAIVDIMNHIGKCVVSGNVGVCVSVSADVSLYVCVCDNIASYVGMCVASGTGRK